MNINVFFPLLIWIPIIIFCLYTYYINIHKNKFNLLFKEVSFGIIIIILLLFSITILLTNILYSTHINLVISEIISAIILMIIVIFQCKIYFFNNNFYIGKMFKYNDIYSIRIYKNKFTFTIILSLRTQDKIKLRVTEKSYIKILKFLKTKVNNNTYIAVD